MVKPSSFLALALSLFVPALVGCAAPTVDPDRELVEESSEALTESPDGFRLMIAGTDRYSIETDLYLATTIQFISIQPGSTTSLNGRLTITLNVKRALLSELTGCAGGFSTDGLTPDAIAARDAELFQACADPVTPIDGREGWFTYDTRGRDDLKSLRYRVTPVITPKQHLVFTFKVGGAVRKYLFVNP